ncbi:MAG: hypothetical protein L6435_17745, partial [Anaerolineae bacterium]|nr:hypothetical protein [Anaerolineae bacterium]
GMVFDAKGATDSIEQFLAVSSIAISLGKTSVVVNTPYSRGGRRARLVASYWWNVGLMDLPNAVERL